MNDRLLHLYHMLPYPLKVLAATAQGYRLRGWRYGPETDRLVAEALERETWSPKKWRVWQEERLAFILHRAATRVPYYREQWSQRHRQGDRASWEYLENWPLLTKEALRGNPTAFLADDINLGRLFHEATSGTTGTPLDLWISRKTLIGWYALFEARWRHWYGVSRHDRWAILGGKLVTSAKQSRPPFWVWNQTLNQLYMSAYHLSPKFFPHYCDALVSYRIQYLYGYSSALYSLAQEILHSGRKDVPMRVVITNAEPLFDYQRQAIAEAFQSPVRETYGMSEMVAAASECQSGRLHLWPEVGVTEVLIEDEPAPPGVPGNLVCTGLLNSDMPLIRYQVGDRATAPVSAADCRCGRQLPVLASLEGRQDDVLYTSDGKSIGRLDPIFKTNLPIREAQIIQETLSRIVVHYVPLGDFSKADARFLMERMQDRLGAVEVILRPVAAIPRGPNGKFRAVISHLPESEKPGWARLKEME